MHAEGVAVSSKSEPLASEPVSFIPVKGSDDVAPPVATWLNPLGIYDQSTTQWLQGQGPSEQQSKQPDAEPDREDALLKAKVEEFNRRVRENPRDIQLWMAFVAFQVSIPVALLLHNVAALFWGKAIYCAGLFQLLPGRDPGTGRLRVPRAQPSPWAFPEQGKTGCEERVQSGVVKALTRNLGMDEGGGLATESSREGLLGEGNISAESGKESRWSPCRGVAFGVQPQHAEHTGQWGGCLPRFLVAAVCSFSQTHGFPEFHLVF